MLNYIICFILLSVASAAVVDKNGNDNNGQLAGRRAASGGAHAQTLERLFGDAAAYDAESPPAVRDPLKSSAVLVNTSVYLNRIAWSGNTAEVDLYLRQQWDDSRLAYQQLNARDGDHPSELVLPRNRRLWQPDAFFLGAGEEREARRGRILILPSGSVKSSEKHILSVTTEEKCNFLFADRRSFRLKLSSQNNPINEVSYAWVNAPPSRLPVELSPELLDAEAELSFEESKAGGCVGNYTNGEYPCISVLVTFVGHSHSKIWGILLPSVLLVFASWFHFWVHRSWSVARVLSAATPFFIFVVLLFWLPRRPHSHGCHSSALWTWLWFCALLTFLSMLEYFFVLWRASRRLVTRTKIGKNVAVVRSHSSQPQHTGYGNNNFNDNGNNNNNNNSLHGDLAGGGVHASGVDSARFDRDVDGGERRYQPQNGAHDVTVISTETSQYGNNNNNNNSNSNGGFSSIAYANEDDVGGEKADKISRFLFPLIFVVFTVLFILYHFIY